MVSNKEFEGRSRVCSSIGDEAPVTVKDPDSVAKSPAHTIWDQEGYGVHPVDEIIVEQRFLLRAVQKGNSVPENNHLDSPAFGEVVNYDGVVHYVVGGESV